MDTNHRAGRTGALSAELRGAGVASWVVMLVLVASGPAGAAMQRPADEDLRALTESGRRIASYHEAIARARVVYGQQSGDAGDGVRPVVVERSGVWHVVFLRRRMAGADAKGWEAVADAVFQPRAGEVDRLQLFRPPKAAPADALSGVRAVEAARIAAQAHAAAAPPPFEEAVFRDRAGIVTVYLQSRAPGGGTVRFAADLRVRTGADGMQIMETAPMHGPGEAVDVAPGGGGTPSLHSHARGDLPTETDVALVIANPRVAPHLVLTPLWMFRIDADGTVTWLGRNEVPPVAPGGGR